ncbi:hypothetical protein [Clostridium sp. CCUG 7971]|uniref:hypothetical protein n=1 Tax=Clostridium sp. CCUG 7971 TaxID=2811414 RepID=UPI001ABAD8B5|nr:hypothetical protein [Clostridium sp. CCUG 7971]MBO3444912.1 hypothetical protein [Clostridium sp. CCUG 7971]
MGNELNDLNKKLKEWKWLIPLIFLVITVSKGFIIDIIGRNTYNIIIFSIIFLFGAYLEYSLIKAIKSYKDFEFKILEKEKNFIITSILIFITMIYIAVLLII